MGGHRRKSTRLKNYDYASTGMYFVTICTRNRECLFGEIVNSRMQMNRWGEIVAKEWSKTPEIRPNVMLDEFVIMPNHMHGIINILPNVGATRRVAPTTMRANGPISGSVGAIIGQFKSATTKRINQMRNVVHAPIWQRNYHDHIMRNEADLNRIREYIKNNPATWNDDRNNPKNEIV